MKSKKTKGTPATPRSSEEDLTLPGHRSNAFSFIKNRFFLGQQVVADNIDSSPRPSTSSSRSTATITKPWTIDTSTDKQQCMSKSFEDSSDFNTVIPRVKTRTTRPMSMMGMESLMQQADSDTISKFDALVTPRKRRNSISNTEKRTSFIVIKEGYLFKKTDFKPFHKQTSGWKLYRVILRGYKLYLYKLTTESPLKSLFPSQQSLTFSLSNTSISSTNNIKDINLQKTEFDTESQLILFAPDIVAKGAVFMELNQITKLPVRKVNLVLTSDGYLYTCIKSDNLWKIESKNSLSILNIDSNHLNSDGVLLFSINNQSSILGLYSIQNHEIGQLWTSTFSEYEQKDEMYDATQRYHLDLVRNHRSDSTITGGSINALIHELLFNNNIHLLNTFITTYTTFTTASKLLNQFDFIISKNTELQDRLFDIFIIWCNQFQLDVMGDVASGMVSILDRKDIINKRKANQVKELVLNTVNQNGIKNCDFNNDLIVSAETSNLFLLKEEDEEEEEVLNQDEVENITAYDIEGKRRDSINLSNLLITGLTPAVFLIIDPSGFAQQIYLFHYSKQKQYEKELMNPLSYLPRPQLSVQMLNSLLFTTVAPHFLTKLIRNQILIDTQQEPEECMLIRSRLLEHWIRIGIHLLELRDMTGWCAVAMGVCSVGIIRLRETWKAVDRDLVNRVQTDWVRVLSDFGLFTQDIWAEGWDKNITNFSRVLDHTCFPDIESKSLPTLPFFGTIRQSVDRLRKHVKKLLAPNTINFEECQCIYDTITFSLNQWKAAKSENDSEQVKLLPIVGPLQMFFEHSITDLMSVPHDYKYLQECSLSCEPRIFGQSFDRRKFSGRSNGQSTNADVAPPSTSSLIFPSILDNCSLLDVDNGKFFSFFKYQILYSFLSVTATATTSTTLPGSTSLTSTASTSAISTTSSLHKKTNKTGANNSIRSIRSFLEDGTKKQPSSSSSSFNNNTTTSHDIVSPSKGANRKAFRRRTYSFPPGSGNPNASSSSKLDLLESENSRTWLGSLISNRHHRTYSTKALIEAHRRSHAAQYGHNGEIILSIQQGELVFKAAAILKKEAIVGDDNSLKKTESTHSIDFLKKGTYYNSHVNI